MMDFARYTLSYQGHTLTNYPIVHNLIWNLHMRKKKLHFLQSIFGVTY